MGSNLKNILIVSFGFLLLFTAYGGLQSLQSSLNADEGLGTASLSVLYGAIILSSMFLPPILIKNLGCKWTIVVSMGCYVAYSLGNLYPSWETLIPTSIILGLGGAPLWSAKCTYLTISGNMQGKKENKEGRDIINQYFGIFFLIFQSSAVWGNLMSSLIFELADDRGVGVLSVILVAVFLDNLDKEAAQEFRDNRQPFFSVFLATFKHLRDKRQVLLIPMTMYSGFEQGFLAGDYNKSYVTCALGIRYVGYSMICFGATNSLFSFAFGKLSHYTGRIALFALGTVTNLSCIIGLFLWKPHPDDLAVFFVFSGLWGMADAVWQTQTNALYGVLFEEHKEAAFANYRLWESVGFVIAFGYSNYLCVDVKLYVVLAVLVVGMVLYGCVEYIEYKNPTACIKNKLELEVEKKSYIAQTKL
ncbi:protein unc-93 homolog A isoform X2 [Polyodon spathula]|uniref:protein unc-93 homolog A isoform X2 n=1 Tax=Polyodon spathula TaxID=7913 RepID=UPI001B7DD3F2|nr:protein unc-93 homolog A isoform X2 [Polyodon spathula]